MRGGLTNTSAPVMGGEQSDKRGDESKHQQPYEESDFRFQ